MPVEAFPMHLHCRRIHWSLFVYPKTFSMLHSPEFPLIPPAIEPPRLTKNVIHSRTLPLEFPRYNRGEPSGRLYQAEQFFA